MALAALLELRGWRTRVADYRGNAGDVRGGDFLGRGEPVSADFSLAGGGDSAPAFSAQQEYDEAVAADERDEWEWEQNEAMSWARGDYNPPPRE